MSAALLRPTSGRATLTSGRGVGRFGVAVVLVCIGVHLVGAVQHWAMSPAISAATITVAAGCGWCVRCLWNHPTIGAWLYAATGFGLMLALHLMMLWGMATPMSGAADHHGMVMPSATAAPVGLDALAYAGIAVPIVGLALAAWVLHRTRSTAGDDGPVEPADIGLERAAGSW